MKLLQSVRFGFILSLLVVLTTFAPAQLTTEERRAISDALFLRNLTASELDFVRRPAGVPVNGLVAQAIDHPLAAADQLLTIHAAANRDLATQLGVAMKLLEIPEGAPTTDAPPAITLPPELPESLRAPVTSLVIAIGKANRAIAAALSGLSPAERRVLIDSLPSLAAGPDVKFAFATQPPASAKTVAELLARVDLARILRAGGELAGQVEAQIPSLRSANATLDQPLVFTAAGIPVEIGTNGPDLHSRNAAGLCIDLGGDDTYTGRYGAGAGVSSVLIDLGGNDTYEVGDLSIGAGLLGVGLAYDLGGHDRFRGRSLVFGAGVAGLGGLFKDGGDDDYVTVALGQGFGRDGIGLLIDTRGADRYRIAKRGQGAAQSRGFGWLIDRAGDDQYLASGSNVQGSAEGGVGFLTDLEGNDVYVAASAAQAAGDVGGLGSLYDAAGRDSYTSDRTSVAFAAHGSAAYLFDLAGDDVYSVRGGACQATAQNRSVAFLLDRDGNDLYSAGDGRPCLSTDGSLALLIEGGGRDHYSGLPGGSVSGRSGDALSLFVDLAGPDGYPEGLDDGAAHVEVEGATALDLPNPGSTPPVEGVGPRPGSAPDPGAEAIDALWAARDGDRLIAIGLPALRRFVDVRAKVADEAELSIALRLARLLGSAARPTVSSHLSGNDYEAIRRILPLVGAAGAVEAGPRIAALLKEPPLQRAAAEAAGLVRATEAVTELLPLAGSPDPDLALTAMLALERIGDQAALSTAQALVTSPQYPIRQSAMRLIAQFSASGTTTAERLLGDPDEKMQRYGIELLGRMGGVDALNRAGKYLTTGTPGLKVQAMLALQGKCPPALRATLLGLRNDPNSFVRAVASRIDPGR